MAAICFLAPNPDEPQVKPMGPSSEVECQGEGRPAILPRVAPEGRPAASVARRWRGFEPSPRAESRKALGLLPAPSVQITTFDQPPCPQAHGPLGPDADGLGGTLSRGNSSFPDLAAAS